MIMTGVDLETTGLKAEEGHQIIEIALCAYKLDAQGFRKIGNTFCQRVMPTVAIDPGAQAVHGISLSDLRGAPTWDKVAPVVDRILQKTNMLVAHNLDFDAPFLAVELKRAGFALPNLSSFCTMQNGRNFTALGKQPSLKELCWACGVDYDDTAAHAADYDIERTMRCVGYALEKKYWQFSNLNTQQAA